MRLNRLLAGVTAIALTTSAAVSGVQAQTPARQDPQEVIIDQGVLRPTQIAVVNFSGENGTDVGAVIRADLWKLAQAPLGGMLRLVEADAARARQAWEAQRRYLALVLQGLSAADWPLAPESAATSAAVAVPPASSANSSSSLQGHPHAD